jgi:dihydrofolate synthase/folylpolyglutamate synthase
MPDDSTSPTHHPTAGHQSSLWQPDIRLGLERIRTLRVRHSTQNNPFAPIWRTIHIAGTKGKGSTAEFIRRLLLAAGYSVGAFFSPYVRHPTEQIQIGNAPIPEDVFDEAIARLQRDARVIGATEFEVTTAAAYLLFDEYNIDFAVIEVGVGGREDATNILENPGVSVLTPIGLDHQDLLGTTLEEIAGHKAGILRSRVPAVVNVPDPQAHAIIATEAIALEAPLWDVHWQPQPTISSRSFSVETPLGRHLTLCAGMRGPFQRENAATAVTVLDQLAATGQIPPLSLEAMQAGLNAADLPGRFDVLKESPIHIIVDGAHNALSARALADALYQEMAAEKVPHRLFLVVGMKANHDVATFLPPFAALNPVGLVATVPGRGKRVPGGVHPASNIAEVAQRAGIPVLGMTEDVVEAVSLVLAWMQDGDILCICGSFLMVSDLDSWEKFPGQQASQETRVP